jgi:hypothetical protein
MRHEIGVETIAFGRDYPDAEGTWPKTRTTDVRRERDLEPAEGDRKVGEIDELLRVDLGHVGSTA